MKIGEMLNTCPPDWLDIHTAAFSKVAEESRTGWVQTEDDDFSYDWLSEIIEMYLTAFHAELDSKNLKLTSVQHIRLQALAIVVAKTLMCHALDDALRGMTEGFYTDFDFSIAPKPTGGFEPKIVE